MLAVNFDEPGGPEVLKLTEAITPKISEDEVKNKEKIIQVYTDNQI